MKPSGLEHQERNFGSIKVPHELISLHQKAFPELREKMANHPDAMKVYAAFLALIPLKIRGELTPEARKKVMEAYKQ